MQCTRARMLSFKNKCQALDFRMRKAELAGITNSTAHCARGRLTSSGASQAAPFPPLPDHQVALLCKKRLGRYSFNK